MPQKLATVEKYVQALSNLTGCRRAAYCDSVAEALAMCYNHSPVLQQAPFCLEHAFPIMEETPVVSNLLFFRNDKFMTKLVPTLDDELCLFFDSHLRGKDALFIIRRYPRSEAGEATMFSRRLMQCHPERPSAVVIGKDRDGGFLIGFQLRQLFE